MDWQDPLQVLPMLPLVIMIIPFSNYKVLLVTFLMVIFHFSIEFMLILLLILIHLRMPYVNNNDYLELAKLDFNNCQALHQLEWDSIQQ